MRNRRLGVGAAVAAVFVTGVWVGIGSAGSLNAHADAVALKASLAVGKEVPKPSGTKAGAGGLFSAGLTKKAAGGTLAWRLTFHGLTGRAIAAHVHMGKPGKAGPVAVALCGPCRSGQRGSAKVNARTVRALLRGTAYVNVHTTKNPGGEIRGQVVKGGKPVGVPTTSTSTETTTTTTTYESPYP
jgi:hypothetical protein